MRILIAGGTGVLGRRIVPLLLGAGHGVTVLARTPARAAPLAARGARVLHGDALDRAAVIAAVAQDAPDVIMHQLTDLAAGSSAANARLRIDATRNLADGALAAGVERIIVQSIAWCYAPDDRAATEDDPLDTISADPGRRTTVDAVISMEDSARPPRRCRAAAQRHLVRPRHLVLTRRPGRRRGAGGDAAGGRRRHQLRPRR